MILFRDAKNLLRARRLDDARRRERSQHQAVPQVWLQLILVAYLLLGLSYALATPPLEASDEYKHYPVVQYVQTEGRLPILDPQRPGRWLQEGAQPPLYYLLMAALTAGIDTGDLPQLHDLNSHAFIGNPNQVANKNLIIHRPQNEAFPWHGSVLAIYTIRFASLLLGAATVLLVARSSRLVFDERVGLLAAALVAFNPMFLFVHAAVNNDALAILLGHAGLYVLLRLWQDAPDPRRAWLRYAGLGLLLGLGLLTKLSLAGLLLLAGFALALLAWRRNEWRLFLIGGPIVLAVALLLAAPWFLRNWSLYGDPIAMNVFVAVQGTRDAAITWRDWQQEFGTFYRTFWGLFGGVNVPAPPFVYRLYNALALLAGVGFVSWLWRRRASGHSVPATIWLLLAWPAILFLLLLRWNVISPAFQGRLIFPGLGALAAVAAAGLLYSLAEGRRRSLALVLTLLAFLLAALLPWTTIRPAYAYPQPLQTVPETAQYGPVRFHAPDGEIQLVGVDLPPGQSVTPGGDPVHVTLYWRAVDPVERNYLSTVHLLGRELVSVGAVNRHPASGMIPTSRWTAGQIWADRYRIYVGEAAAAPARLRLRVGLFDPTSGSDLPMTDPTGNTPQLLTVGEARLAAPAQREMPQAATRAEIAFGQGVILEGYQLSPRPVRPGETLTVSLYWRATATPAQEYTVFLHLLDGDEQLVIADAPPLSGDYPTSFWRAGDLIEDNHYVALPPDLPPGEYELALGLYDPLSGERLSRLDGGNAVRLPLTVAAPPP